MISQRFNLFCPASNNISEVPETPMTSSTSIRYARARQTDFRSERTDAEKQLFFGATVVFPEKGDAVAGPRFNIMLTFLISKSKIKTNSRF